MENRKGGRRSARKSGSQNFETFGYRKVLKKNWVQDKLLFDASSTKQAQRVKCDVLWDTLTR